MSDPPRCSRTGAHLLKHTVTPEVAAAAVAALGPDQLEAGKAIVELRQPRLRQVFQQVYSVATASGNNDWMRSKLLQAVGLSPRWRPQREEAAAEEPTSSGHRPCQRQRRPPAALLQAELDSARSASGQLQLSGARRRSQSQGCGYEGGGKRARGAPPARPAASSPEILEKAPMVVIVMADRQGQLHMPSWPGLAKFPAQLSAAGSLPVALPLAGGSPMPTGHILQAIQQAQQAQQAQQTLQHALLARQVSAEKPPSLVQVKEEGALAQLPHPSSSAQLAAWRALQAAGFWPQLAEQSAALAAAQPPAWDFPPARQPALTAQEMCVQADVPAAWLNAPPSPPMAMSASAPQAQAPALADAQQQRHASPLTGTSLCSGGTAAPSPFAAVASLPLPPLERADTVPASLQQARSLPASTLDTNTGDLSLMGLDALLAEGVGSASLASPCSISTDLHRLFSAWEQGLVSMPRPCRGPQTVPAGARR